jgi:hypothetical protein
LQSSNIFWDLYAQRVRGSKWENESINDPMEMCFEHKTNMKVDCRISNIKKMYNYVFITYIVIFLWSMSSHDFFMFRHVHMFSLFLGCIQLMCDTKWCSPYYVCIMWKEMMKKLENQYIYVHLMHFFLFG